MPSLIIRNHTKRKVWRYHRNNKSCPIFRFLCIVLWIVVCHFVFFLLAIVLSVRRFTASDYLCGVLNQRMTYNSHEEGHKMQYQQRRTNRHNCSRNTTNENKRLCNKNPTKNQNGSRMASSSCSSSDIRVIQFQMQWN